jgi:hypothetical protein
VELIRESAGVIPSFWIGSLWKNGQLLDDQRYPGTFKDEFDITLPAEWEIVAANSLVPNESKTGKPNYLLPPFVHPLSGKSESSPVRAFLDAPTVKCADSLGRTVLIPCYEIFRRYYGVTSTLANAILSVHWKFALAGLIDEEMSGLKSDKIVVAPHAQMDDLSCCVIANLIGVPAAGRAAMKIQTEIENHRNQKRGEPWIRATPPFGLGKFRVSGTGKKINDRTFLLLHIECSTFPELPHPVERYVKESRIRLSEDNASGEDGQATATVRTKAMAGEISIARSADVSARGRKFVTLATGDAWEQPFNVREVVEGNDFYVAPNGPREDEIEEVPMEQHTVKAPSMFDERPPTNRVETITSEHQVLVSRFAMLHAALVHLQSPQIDPKRGKVQPQISAWTSVSVGDAKVLSFGIVSPFPIKSDKGVPFPWAQVKDGEVNRPRQAWIVEIVFQGAPTYLLEIEACRNETFRMLYFEYRDAKNPLHLLAIPQLLTEAAEQSGKWPKNSPDTLVNLVKFRARRHVFNESAGRTKMVSPKSIIAAIMGLRRP